MRSFAVGASVSDCIRSLLLALLLGPFTSGRVVESLRGAGSARAKILSWALTTRVENNIVGDLVNTEVVQLIVCDVVFGGKKI